ncbi:hypothetical protein G6F58_013660 [Rhizopus delemar]|nr:hypothetical protein G6F58_013660 [Rhizopus delemar]
MALAGGDGVRLRGTRHRRWPARLGVRRCAAAAVGGRRGALVRVVGAGPAGDGTGPAAWPPGRADQGAGRGRAPAAGVVPDRRPGRCRP